MDTPHVTVAMLEAQKEREASWVRKGAETFMARLDEADPSMTPVGRGIMRACYDNLVTGLEAFIAERIETPRAMQNPTFRVLMALGCHHVAAVTLHITLTVVISRGGKTDPREITALKAAENLARALEHDLRFRVWRENATEAEAVAVKRMREKMKGTPKTWRSRLQQLRELAEVQWDDVDKAVLGMDLLGVMVEANPETFMAPVITSGHKSYKIIDLTLETTQRLMADTAAMATARPKFGAMIVPPLPWRYE